MKKIIILSLFILFGLQNVAQTASYKSVDAATFKSMIDKKDGVVLDVRTDDEVKKGIIKGAIQVDFLAKNFEAVVAKMDKSKKYYIYCAGGGRSADACDYMSKQGFTNVVNLEKGYSDWLKKGMEVQVNK